MRRLAYRHARRGFRNRAGQKLRHAPIDAFANDLSSKSFSRFQIFITTHTSAATIRIIMTISICDPSSDTSAGFSLRRRRLSSRLICDRNAGTRRCAGRGQGFETCSRSTSGYRTSHTHNRSIARKFGLLTFCDQFRTRPHRDKLRKRPFVPRVSVAKKRATNLVAENLSGSRSTSDLRRGQSTRANIVPERNYFGARLCESATRLSSRKFDTEVYPPARRRR